MTKVDSVCLGITVDLVRLLFPDFLSKKSAGRRLLTREEERRPQKRRSVWSRLLALVLAAVIFGGA